MCIIDNSILSFAFDLDNGVPINSYIGNEDDDRELLFLYSFLEEAVSAPDIRVNIRESFKLSHLQSSIINVAQTPQVWKPMQASALLTQNYHPFVQEYYNNFVSARSLCI